MQKINNLITTYFFISLGLSIALPLGILGVVFGAVKGMTALLVVGIVLTVLGFYVMPIMWIKYGEKRGDRSLLRMIEKDYLYTVSALALQSGYSENDVRARIKKMIMLGVLEGFLFINDELVLNENEKQEESVRPSVKCENCGAEIVYDGEKYQCEYCRSIFTK